MVKRAEAMMKVRVTGALSAETKAEANGSKLKKKLRREKGVIWVVKH